MEVTGDYCYAPPGCGYGMDAKRHVGIANSVKASHLLQEGRGAHSSGSDSSKCTCVVAKRHVRIADSAEASHLPQGGQGGAGAQQQGTHQQRQGWRAWCALRGRKRAGPSGCCPLE